MLVALAVVASLASACEETVERDDEEEEALYNTYLQRLSVSPKLTLWVNAAIRRYLLSRIHRMRTACPREV